MVVIVLVFDPRGPYPTVKPKKVTYSSRIFLKPSFLYRQVEPGETFATTKEEEWVSKKKTEVTNTKQIETRVKRQVVLEDGKVVEDSGPMVTSNTTEDTQTHEHHATELRKLGDDEENQRAIEEGKADGTIAERSNWVAVPNPDGVVREVNERRVVSREETEEVKETEDVQHLGDITDEDFLSAVNSGKRDLRHVLRTASENGRAIVSTGPRVLRDTSKSNKVIDTEESRELSSVQPDGRIVTEAKRTTEHEEINDDECPDDVPDQDYEKEKSSRYKNTREQEEVDYLADGRKIGHEMRFKTDTLEVEKRGLDGADEVDFDSLSARARRRQMANTRQIQPHRYRGSAENGVPVTTASPLDRKDAVTRRPLDFDQEEETRKHETSKWLEHHFGSESRSSNSTLDEEDPLPVPPKTSFFNVTIKSSPPGNSPPQKPYGSMSNLNGVAQKPPFGSMSNLNGVHRVYSPVEPERDRNHHAEYYKGISEWSERRQEHYTSERRSPQPYRRSPSPNLDHPRVYSPNLDHPRVYSPNLDHPRVYSPNLDHPKVYSPNLDHARVYSPKPDYRTQSPRPDYRTQSPIHDYRHRSPIPDYRQHHSPTPDYSRNVRISPKREEITPTPPQRKRQVEKQQRQRIVEERTRYDSGYRSRRDDSRDRMKEPPPDYLPPSPPPMPTSEKKQMQKTRFASDPPKTKSGNIIGQSIRKLVGKIRSASAERKAKQRAKRSPSPSYQQGHVIDSNIGMDRQTPVQRYYLGEDPFSGSIYGRENKYDGVKPAKNSSRKSREEERRSQSTLGRFSRSAGRLVNGTTDKVPIEIPTKLEKSGTKSNSTINVSITNRNLVAEGPAKPARTYHSSLSRSKSLNVHQDIYNTGSTKPNMSRLDEKNTGLKSPGLISSLGNSRSHDSTEEVYTSRFTKNGTSSTPDGSKRVFLSTLKDRAPELYKTINDNEDWKSNSYSTQMKSSTTRNYNDIYEPPTRLRDTVVTPQYSVTRRGSNSSTDFSETYHTTSRNDDPLRPSVTNTTKTVSKKTLPARGGRGVETIESSETRSVTKSHSQHREPTKYGEPIKYAEPIKRYNEPVKYYETERRYNTHTSTQGNPVVIEDRNSEYSTQNLRDTKSYTKNGFSDTQNFEDIPKSILRKGSNASDFSETYHTTTKNDDPLRPSVTNTTKTVSKKTLAGKDGTPLGTVHSTQTRSVTESESKNPRSPAKVYETRKTYNSTSNGTSRNSFNEDRNSKYSTQNLRDTKSYTPTIGYTDNQNFEDIPRSILRKGSNASDFSETYHTTTKNDDPLRPSVTNTTKTVSKKTLAGKDGTPLGTVHSTQTRSVTESESKNPRNPAIYETRKAYSTSNGTSRNSFNEDRNSKYSTQNLRDTKSYTTKNGFTDTQNFEDVPRSILRKGSNASDFSETYHTTTKNDDPLRPSVTNTTKTVSKKTLAGKDGTPLGTVHSTQTRSVTESESKNPRSPAKVYETKKLYNSTSNGTRKNSFNGDKFGVDEPDSSFLKSFRSTEISPTYSRDSRRGSNASSDYSRTYHTTTRNDDPYRPSVTDTTKTVSKKTIPSKNGLATVESSKTRSYTTSKYKQ